MTSYDMQKDKFLSLVDQFEGLTIQKYLLPEEDRKIPEIKYGFCIDLEATCASGPFDDNTHEVIEIGVVLVDFDKDNIIDTFNTFVKPTNEDAKVLSDFCKNFTGIKQEDIDSAPSFIDALELLNQWVGKYDDILEPKPSTIKYPKTIKEAGEDADFPIWTQYRNFVWISHGLADFERFFAMKSCTINKTPLPPYMLGRYVDSMQHFSAAYRLYRTRHTMQHMCSKLNIPIVNQHRAIDDAILIGKIALKLEKKVPLRISLNAFIDMDSPAYSSKFGTFDYYLSKDIRKKDFRYTPVETYSVHYKTNVLKKMSKRK